MSVAREAVQDTGFAKTHTFLSQAETTVFNHVRFLEADIGANAAKWRFVRHLNLFTHSAANGGGSKTCR